MALGHELSVDSLFKLTSFLAWSWLYVGCAIQYPDQSPEWNSRAITLVHGSVATVVGLAQCGIRTLSPCHLTMKVMPWHYALMVWSWGYFAFDLLWCVVYWSESALMLCHHISALIAITIYMQKQYTGCTFACTLALLEITNPLLQIRWFLKNGGQNKTVIFMIVEVTYLVMFVLARGILGTYLMYKILNSDVFDTDQKIISVIFYIVSAGFLYNIFKYVEYKYKTTIGKLREYIDGIVLSDRV
ncbi:TLC domain-containing protein 5 [Manduca sexta]|uniref:TLC domain-containing protein n=1 Tax=Manduca sexta TaxID=7130 RepID=A0A922CHE5_MANSE|nr:TLC domain-containing protein 5 [Manduca sexta]KAG6445683.1 hypothetical protein O3G_MSEX004061 [Manduca sexta]